MAFITSGPIHFSGGENSLYSFMTGAGADVGTLSLSGFYSAASGVGVELTGATAYPESADPRSLSGFYGMTACCILWEDGTCMGLEGGKTINLENCT